MNNKKIKKLWNKTESLQNDISNLQDRDNQIDKDRKIISANSIKKIYTKDSGLISPLLFIQYFRENWELAQVIRYNHSNYFGWQTGQDGKLWRFNDSLDVDVGSYIEITSIKDLHFYAIDNLTSGSTITLWTQWWNSYERRFALKQNAKLIFDLNYIDIPYKNQTISYANAGMGISIRNYGTPIWEKTFSIFFNYNPTRFAYILYPYYQVILLGTLGIGNHSINLYDNLVTMYGSDFTRFYNGITDIRGTRVIQMSIWVGCDGYAPQLIHEYNIDNIKII